MYRVIFRANRESIITSKYNNTGWRYTKFPCIMYQFTTLMQCAVLYATYSVTRMCECHAYMLIECAGVRPIGMRKTRGWVPCVPRLWADFMGTHTECQRWETVTSHAVTTCDAEWRCSSEYQQSTAVWEARVFEFSLN